MSEAMRLAAIAREMVVPPQRRSAIDEAHPLPTQRFDGGKVPRFELYHAPFSICSNKVRLVLAELNQPWLSHEMVITTPEQENYQPDYVRLRLASDVAQGTAFATKFSGGSSVAESGFDALVVPTLVDTENSTVIADSKNICLYLCREVQGTDLLPANLASQILAEVENADTTPHVALLYGANPDGDRRPPVLRHGTANAHDHKIMALETARTQASDIDAAYAAKIERERSAGTFVDDPSRMRRAIDKVDAQIAVVENILGKVDGPWLFGEHYTLADAMWTLSLFRLEYLGYGYLWRDARARAAVSDYADAGYARPACANAVRLWPGAPPSEWVADLMTTPDAAP